MKKLLLIFAVVAIGHTASAQTPAPSEQQPQTPAPDKNITITLPLSIWNNILELLLSGEYRKVAPIIGEIQAQAAPQLNPPAADSTSKKQPTPKPKK